MEYVALNNGVKIRAIGISNFYVDRMVDFVSFNRIKPAINQVEIHIFNQQKQIKEYADKYGIQLEAWAPFGEGRKGTFDNETVAAIGKKYGKTPAQVMLRWHIQRGIVVIPKSAHKERMEENFLNCLRRTWRRWRRLILQPVPFFPIRILRWSSGL